MQVSRDSRGPAGARQELAALHVAAALRLAKHLPSTPPSALLSRLPTPEARLVVHSHSQRARPEPHRSCVRGSSRGGGSVESQWASQAQRLMQGACAMLDAHEQMEVLERTLEVCYVGVLASR